MYVYDGLTNFSVSQVEPDEADTQDEITRLHITMYMMVD